MNTYSIWIVGLLLFFSFKYFLPGYFKEKGKNLATKQDIEDITEKIERIKMLFSKDLEFIKSDLNYYHQSKFSIKSAERETLIELNLKYSEWLNYLMNLSFAHITMYNYNKLNEYYDEIKNKKYLFDTSESKLHLFIHDDELMKVKSECKIETIVLERIIVEGVAVLINKYSLMHTYFSTVINSDSEVNYQWYKEQKNVAQAEIDKIFYKMMEDKNEQYNEVEKKKAPFIIILQKRLFDIMK